ncbi:hypothetical protein BBJ28_00012164 [Nothophytophthora sp. Chile5]|nr:hypothetical protein BBJ28_00012164 [Nothophytophthora sp. Chile5]
MTEEHKGLYIATAFQLNAAAALATVLGGLVICSSRTLRLATPMALATTLSVSGGVTIFLSLVLLFGFSVMEFVSSFQTELDDYDTVIGRSWLASTVCLGIGIVIVYIVDFIVNKLTPGVGSDSVATTHGPQPSVAMGSDDPSLQDNVMLESPQDQGFVKMDEAAKQKLQRMGVLSGIAIALHNIPSGIATFVAGAEHPEVGLSMAIGVGLHNIAEGVAVAAPVYFATGSKWKGIMWCVVAAIAEHMGAFIAFAVIGKEAEDYPQAVLYGIAAGMMATITMKEIFPTAYMYANGRIHLVSNGALVGMLLMAITNKHLSDQRMEMGEEDAPSIRPLVAPGASNSSAEASTTSSAGIRSPSTLRSPSRLRSPSKLPRFRASGANAAENKKRPRVDQLRLERALQPSKRLQKWQPQLPSSQDSMDAPPDHEEAVEEASDAGEAPEERLQRDLQVAQCLERDLVRDNARMRLKAAQLREDVQYYYQVLAEIRQVACEQGELNGDQEREKLADGLRRIISAPKPETGEKDGRRSDDPL